VAAVVGKSVSHLHHHHHHHHRHHHSVCQRTVRQQVYRKTEMMGRNRAIAGIYRYRGSGDGRIDREYIFVKP